MFKFRNNSIKLISVGISFMFLFSIKTVQGSDYPEETKPKYDPYYEEILKSKGVSLTTEGLIKALKNNDSQVRKYSVIEIGEKKLEKVVPDVKNLIEDKELTEYFRTCESLF